MDVITAIGQRRSIRKFQDKPVPDCLLQQLVSLGRLYASGGNLQPIRFGIVTGQALREAMFREIRWAMYLPDFVIRQDQQPQAYILLLSERSSKRSVQFDLGAAATTIMLAATSQGLGTCCLGAFRESELSRLLQLDDGWKVELVIALGYPSLKLCRALKKYSMKRIS